MADALVVNDARISDAVVAVPDASPPPLYTGSFPALSAGVASTTTVYLTVRGTKRRIELHVPASRGARPALVLAFHGTSGMGYDWIDPDRDPVGFKAMANAHGVIVAAPWAEERSDGDWDGHAAGSINRYWHTYPDTGPDTNVDLLLVRAIIAEAERAYSVDPARVYTVGHSNGGFFSLTAAVALRDQIAAFGENSSGLVRCASTDDCYFKSSTATECGALAKEPGYCACSGTEKPVALPSGRIPPGYLTHNAGDQTVSVSFTCELAGTLASLGQSREVHIGAGPGHGLPDGYAEAVWTFLSAHPR